ncbi:MAG: hypothetical protein NC117_04430 [Pseudoflavonifractor sp.]|nr:hypothetical protein [Pseudoflavonifractor sp.]
MRPTVYHKPSTRERHIVAPNYTYAFARWLKNTTGRTLCPPHRHIIDRLECARLSAAPVPIDRLTTPTPHTTPRPTPLPWRHRPYTLARIIISDPAPDYTHIADLLVHYIHWLRTTILPHRQTLILDRTATAAHTLINTLPAPPTKLHAIGSGCRPATHRGGTFDIILLLNADTYPISRPRPSHVGLHARASASRHSDALDSALDTFLPMLQPHRESILIIHGSPHPRPPRRNAPRRLPTSYLKSKDTLTTLTTLTTLNSLTSQNHPPRPPRRHPTPFLHYLTASLDGDLDPFIPIDPESIPRNHHSGCPPSAAGLSQRDSNNERTPCFSTGTASVSVTSPGGTSNCKAVITPPYIPLTYAAAAPAA